MAVRFFEYRHVVGFEETNLLGNVYFTHLFRWQGKCREMFLREQVPELLEQLGTHLYLVTSRSSCDFLAEAFAFDEISVRMNLADLSQSRITMGFEYVRLKNGKAELIARGEQQVVCMRKSGTRTEVAEVPAALRAALERYR